MSLTSLTLLLCLPTARAQSGYPSGSGGSGYPGSPGWVAKAGDPVVTGNITDTFTDAQGNVSHLDKPYTNYGSSPDSLKVNAGESLTYKVNGTVTYTWTWNGGPNNLPPPSSQGVLETAGAGAYGGGDVSGTVTVIASDGGIGKESKTDSVSADGKTQSHGDSFGGSQVVTVDGSSGTLTVTGTMQAECDLSEPKSSGGYPGGGYPGGGYPGSGGSGTLWGNAGGNKFTAILDTRGVSISASVDSTYWKKRVSGGYVDANGDPVCARVLHQREPDGTMRGDIGLNYGSSDYNDPGTYVSVTFGANTFGSWATNLSQYLWNTSLKNASYPGTLYGVPPDPGIQVVTNLYRKPYIPNETQIPLSVVASDAGDVSGNAQVDHLFFKYQNGDNRPDPWTPYVTGNDGDEVTATANYYLSLHQPHEFNRSAKHGILQPGEGQENIIYREATLDIKSNPPYATPGNGVQCEWNAPSPFWGYGAEAASVLSNAPWPYKWLGVAVGAAGLGLSDFGPKPDSATINFDSNTWNDLASQFPPDHPKGQYPMADYRMTPGQHMRYLRHFQLHDTYDMQGYGGETLESFDTYAGKGPSFGIFTWAPL